MAVDMSQESRQQLKKLEENSRFPTGVGRIDRGECPLGSLTPMSCMFCEFGHMLECHHPYTCDEIECSHYDHEDETYEEDPI